MIRIGIIGSDSSHADAFSALANLPDSTGNYRYADVRITAIWGEDPIRTRALSQKNKIETVCEAPGEMHSLVDAVMVVLRNGGTHLKYALPFVQAGMPVWVDKPFTTDFAGAQKLVDASIARGSVLAGGSTCKYCGDVLQLQKERRTLCEAGDLLSGAFNFPGSMSSPWGGIWFYGGHAAEILTTIFGDCPVSITSQVHGDNIFSLVKYPSFGVTINFAEVPAFWGSLYAPERVVMQPIDIDGIYQAGFEAFILAVRTGKMQESYASLLRPVLILEALEKSVLEHTEVPVRMQVLKQYESWEHS